MKARMAAESSAKKMIRMNRKNCKERGGLVSPGGRRQGRHRSRTPPSVCYTIDAACPFCKTKDFAAVNQAPFIMSVPAIRLGGQRGCNANVEKVNKPNKPSVHTAALSRGLIWTTQPGRPGGDGHRWSQLWESWLPYPRTPNTGPPFPAAASAPHGR